ncbi:helix-turn-helix transcriptional regulator [Actinacidiphila acididurans]|uniref:Helix-turn-helix domain-containing protein n=1 Tax=Actinacidiphila acididurans TaxID=2784346 RepID=A0ABS2TXH6_9ACTN|nr:LuxR C-terminal-related transcriptional regulator [Actinacidiphila acididurans]MBM9508039.1 helix-turn-helix domain-containing protein [Actinacidiphila acididurans]
MSVVHTPASASGRPLAVDNQVAPGAVSSLLPADDTGLRLYLTLRSHGEASPSELGTRLGIPVQEAERATLRLAKLGLVQQAESPGRVLALDPDAALMSLFESYEARVQSQIDDLERFQADAESLVHRYRPAVRREAVEVEVEVVRGQARMRFIHALNASARQDNWSMHPGPLPSAEVLESSLAQDAALIERGVRVRAVYGRSAVSGQRGRWYLAKLAGLGAEVRLAPQVPFDLMVYDAQTTLLPGDPGDPVQAPLLVLRGSRLMPSYIALYEDVWLRSIPFTSPQAPPPVAAQATTVKHPAVLQLLANGLTDDQIGRRLGISVRTVGRAVSELMEQMGALSRFQLGVIAAGHGLIQPAANSPDDLE